MFDGDLDESSADSQQESLCHLCEKLVTKIASTKFAGKSFHSACNAALRSRWRAMKTYGDNNAKDRDVTFMLKDAPNWRKGVS